MTTETTPAAKLAGAVETLWKWREADMPSALRAAIKEVWDSHETYRQAQQAQGESLPPGMTLKDVWEVVRWLESREVIRVDTPAFETNKRRAFTYAALKQAVEAQKGGKG